MKAEQGDILRVASLPDPVVVVSNNYFNETGAVVVCPIAKSGTEGPLHIMTEHSQIAGVVMCEYMKLIDLKARRFSKIGMISYYETLNIADAVMGIFDYQLI